MIETIDDWYFTPEYQVMVWIPKFTSLLSIVGSICIIANYFRDRSRREKVFNNIVLYLSFFDIIFSLAHFAGTWMLPRDFAYLAAGTTSTCSIQGFLFVFAGGTSMLYGTVLSTTFVLVINYRWTETDLKRWKSYLLYIPIAANLVFAIVPFIGQLYNPVGTWGCYVATYPRGCSGDDCERGMEQMYLPLKVLITAVQLLYFVGMIACMVLLYTAVLRQEKRMSRYSMVGSWRKGQDWKKRHNLSESLNFPAQESSSKLNMTCTSAREAVPTSKRKINNKRNVSIAKGGAAKEVALQGFKYTCAWLITFIWWYAILFTEIRIDAPPAPMWLYIIHSFFSPMQGLLNFLVYFKRSAKPCFPSFCRRDRSDAADKVTTSRESTGEPVPVTTSLKCLGGSLPVSLGEPTNADCDDQRQQPDDDTKENNNGDLFDNIAATGVDEDIGAPVVSGPENESDNDNDNENDEE